MPAGNSAVEVTWFQHPQHGPSLLVVASDPEGIQKIEVFSRHRRDARVLETTRTQHVEEVIPHYPVSWFPVTVRLTDCDTNGPFVDVHGPFDEDGDPVDEPEQAPPLPT